MCERTETLQQACVQRVEAVSVDSPTKAEEECCLRLMDTCNCDELENGNLAACGMAQEEERTEVRECLVSESLGPTADPG